MDRLKREGNPPTGQLASPKPQYRDVSTDGWEELQGEAGGSYVKDRDAIAKLEQVRALLSGVATEAKLEQARLLLASLDGKDHATNAELQAVKAELQAVKTNQTNGNQKVQLNGNLEELTTANINAVYNSTMRTPTTGVKTVTATAAEVFAGASRLANRRKVLLKNEDPVLRCRVGSSAVSQQNGYPLEPGAALEMEFEPAVVVPIYAISEGANLQLAVIEL